MLNFKGSGYKNNKEKSRDEIIKSGYKHSADIFKVNKVLKSFHTNELSPQESLEYIIKDSLDCMTLYSPEPKLSDFGLKQSDIDNMVNIKYIALFNIISVIVCALVFALITSAEPKSSILFFLVLYGIIWGFYFNCNNTYKTNLEKINMYNTVIALYQERYNKLIEIEKGKEQLRQEAERRRQQEERRRQELKRRKQLEYWENIINSSLSKQERGIKFEKEMAELYRALGYETKLTQQSRDGGIDIILTKNGERIFVQCKFHKERIGVKDIKELWADKVAKGADKCIMLTYAGISNDGEQFIALVNKGRTKNNLLYEYYDIDDIIDMYELVEKTNL